MIHLLDFLQNCDFFRKPYILIMKVKLFRLKMDYQNLRICQKN